MHLRGCQPVSGCPNASSRVSDAISALSSPSRISAENGINSDMINSPVSLGMGA